jgi:hypothetical protein
MDVQQTNGPGPRNHRPWLRFAVAVVIMAVLVTVFEVALRPGSDWTGLDSGRILRTGLIALAAAAFISFGARRR